METTIYSVYLAYGGNSNDIKLRQLGVYDSLEKAQNRVSLDIQVDIRDNYWCVSSTSGLLSCVDPAMLLSTKAKQTNNFTVVGSAKEIYCLLRGYHGVSFEVFAGYAIITSTLNDDVFELVEDSHREEVEDSDNEDEIIPLSSTIGEVMEKQIGKMEDTKEGGVSNNNLDVSRSTFFDEAVKRRIQIIPFTPVETGHALEKLEKTEDTNTDKRNSKIEEVD